MSQRFPDYGIVAGAPVYDGQAVGLSGLWADKATQATPAPIQKLPNGNPILYPAFPEADQIPRHDCVAPARDDILHAACGKTYDSAYWS
jgi:hypothetical protein